jgi:hypothetical protein
VQNCFFVFEAAWERDTFSGMNEKADEVKNRRLSDAYAARGFRVLQRVDSHEFDRRIFVLTLARRPKKRRGVAAAENGRIASTISAGGGRATLAAETGKSISISRCGGSTARHAA